MNSKMKSTFAIIAVALMVLVAVVPMISVFTGSSDAAVVTDPTEAKEYVIKIDVNVKDATGSANSSQFVKIAYGSGYTQIKAPEASGKASFDIYEKTVPSVTVSYGTEAGVADSDYPSVTLTNLSYGNTYTANLQAGHKTYDLKFAFANTAVTYMTSGVIPTTATPVAQYKIYAGETAETATEKESGYFTMRYDATNGWWVGSYKYPAAAGTYFIAVTSFSTASIDFDSTMKYQVQADQTAKAKQTLATIAPTALPTVITIEKYTGYYTVSETPKTISYTAIKSTMGPATTDVAYFVTEMPTDVGTNTVTYKADLAANGTKYTDATIASGTSYTLAEAFYGTVKLLTYTQAGTLAATLTKQTPTSETDVISLTGITVDADGKFFSFAKGMTASPKVTGISFTSGSTFTASDINSFTAGSNIDLLTTVTTGTTTVEYASVNGLLYLGSGETVYLKDRTLTVTGASTFGSRVTTDSTTANFGFAAEKGKNITISIPGVTLSGDVSSVTGTSSTGLKIHMPTQEVSVKVQNALGKSLADATVTLYTAATGGSLVQTESGFALSSGLYKAKIAADATPTSYFVNVVLENYTFTRGAYVKDQAYKAEEATYKLSVYKADGTTVNTDVTDAMLKVYAAKAYKNSIGEVIYEYTGAQIGTIASGVATFNSKKALIDAGESTITTTKIDLMIAVKASETLDTKGIYRDVYVITSDSVDTSKDGIISIVADKDSLSAKLVRNDGVTPISGIKVTLNNETTSTYTQNDGSFTVYSNTVFVAADVVKFDAGESGYAFTAAGYSVLDVNGDKKETFSPDKDVYAFVFVDADLGEILVTGTQPTITGATYIDGSAVANVAKYQAAYDEVDDIAITLAGRSFEDHTLTATEMSSGVVVITSNQETYTFYTFDANDEPLAGVVIDLYTYCGDQPVKTTSLAPTALNATETLATTTVLLPYCGGATPDAVGTEYAYVAQTKTVPATATTPVVKYYFDEDVEDIDDVDISVESSIGLITVKLRDAAGVNKNITPATVEIFDGIFDGPAVYSKEAGKFTFYGEPEESYNYKVTVAEKYSFVPHSEDIDGFLFAQEETLNGALMDADGIVIPFSMDVTITPVLKDDATSKINAATLTAGAKSFDITVNTDDVKKYTITVQNGDTYKGVYTFSDFSSTYMCANEGTILFSAATANGVGLNATFADMQAYDAENKPLVTAAGATIDGKGIIIDADKAVYYEATVTSAGYTFDKKSLLPLFIANETFLTGSVPYSGSGTQGVTLELYLNDNLVQEIKDNAKVKIVDNYYYEAILDLSGYSGDVAAVEFDTILVVYYENGVEVGYVSVDPYTAVNNIIPPTYEVYTVQLLPPSILVASHVGMERVGDTVTVTADGNFMIADDEGVYTDGQYTYTFAGWYVDNQKVSTSPVFTFELTDDVVISPQYTVTYEKTSDANDKQTPQPQPVQPDNSIDTNVLIIGICAVIVALIAVVYAVIKKE